MNPVVALLFAGGAWAAIKVAGERMVERHSELIPTGIGKGRRSLLQIALNEVGIEGATQSERADFADNEHTNNIYGSPSPELPWSVHFARWCCRQAVQSGRMPPYPFSSLGGGNSISRTVESAIQQGLWIPRDSSYVPIPGDLAATYVDGVPGHLVLVLSVSCDLTEINTVEGNDLHQVWVGRRPARNIAGYINLFSDADTPMNVSCGVFDGMFDRLDYPPSSPGSLVG